MDFTHDYVVFQEGEPISDALPNLELVNREAAAAEVEILCHRVVNHTLLGPNFDVNWLLAFRRFGIAEQLVALMCKLRL